jgi:hypothetical protein
MGTTENCNQQHKHTRKSMPITIEEPRAAGVPVVKRTAIGETFNGAIIGVASRDRMKRGEDGVSRPMLKPDGKARQELVVHCVTMPGTTAPAGLGDESGVPAPGDVVRLILKGKAYGDWIEAKKALGRGINVGDTVITVTDTAQVYDANGEPSGKAITTQAELDAVPRGRSVGVYGPLTLAAADPAWIAAAEAAYHALKAPIAAEAPAPEEEEPF